MKERYLYIVVFIAGAAVLAIELLGTRILGPFYGVSLFLWSALITVTLIALSIGYTLGGQWADKGPNMSHLYYLIAGAGLWTLFIPWIKAPILVIAEPFGLRFAVLIAAFILFVPPLTLLGMVSPYAIRVQAANLDVVGRTAGNLYALSTVGSVVAALSTGFILIPNIGVSRLTLMIGVMLLICAGIGFGLTLKSNPNNFAIILILIAFIVLAWQFPRDEVDPEKGIVAIEQSPYAEIRVLDTDGTRFLIIDGGVHTMASKLTYRSYFPYVDLVNLPQCFFQEPGDLLLIGVGGGSVVKSYAQTGWEVEAVEIDPVVVDIARTYFRLNNPEGKIFTMDGRRFLQTQAKTYDVIVMDAFGSTAIPFHLVTEEVFGLIASNLNPDGVLAINVESKGWDTLLVRSLAATLRQHFSHVIALPAGQDPQELHNVVIFAANTELTLPEPDENNSEQTCEFSTTDYSKFSWANRFEPDSKEAIILTDDLNPIDVWTEEINYASREELHRYFEENGLSSY